MVDEGVIFVVLVLTHGRLSGRVSASVFRLPRVLDADPNTSFLNPFLSRPGPGHGV